MSQLPPMSPPPPSGPMGVPTPAYNSQPQRGNIAAVLSLITGILLCVPGFGILAIIFGIVGISKSNKPNTGGKGLAIAGLILGVFGLIWTGIFVLGGGAALVAYRMGGPVRDAGKHFIADVSSGNLQAATADCTSDVSPDALKATIAEAQAWGPVKDTTFFSFNVNDTNGSKTGVIGGLATFANTKKSFTATLTKQGDTFKVSEYNFAEQK